MFSWVLSFAIQLAELHTSAWSFAQPHGFRKAVTEPQGGIVCDLIRRKRVQQKIGFQQPPLCRKPTIVSRVTLGSHVSSITAILDAIY
jgi:hypothetical protein